MKKTFQKTLVAVSVGAALGVMSQSAMADANLLPAIKVGGGWVSVVSYINTHVPVAGSASVSVHATYQVKNLANLDDNCTHFDGRSATTPNDLTTTVISVADGGRGSVFPVGDVVGGALINPGSIGTPTTEGFLVLENYNTDATGLPPPALNGTGPVGTLTSDAIVFNLASGYLYSNRALSVTHASTTGVIAHSPNGFVNVLAPGCGPCNTLTGHAGAGFNNGPVGNLTRFAFLPPSAPAMTGAYVIPTNWGFGIGGAGAGNDDARTTNLVTALGYRARGRFEARMDASHGYALGIYDRLEDNRSLSQTNTLTCVGQLSPQQITGNAIPAFIVNGGWLNLGMRAWNNGGVTPGVDLFNTSDSSLVYKVEFATGYGLSIQPMHQQWYTK